MDVQIKLRLLYGMMRIRSVEEAIATHYSEQEMRCPVHLSIGQEAVAVGICAALRPDDYVLSTHRGHAHYLAKGGDLKSMLAEIYGKATGCCSGKGGSMHLMDLGAGMLGCTPIVGGSLPVAVGTAFSASMLAQDRVTAVFFGEGATEEGVFAESLNFAALKKLPVLFVCENNLYSVYSPLSVRQPAERDRCAIAAAHGIAAFKGDGNDIEVVYTAAAEAVQHLRDGRGPAYLEFSTYRWREHCGPNYDNRIGYRTEDEFLKWRALCPIENYRNRLLGEAVVTEGTLRETEERLLNEIGEAFAFAKSSPFPEMDRLFMEVYEGGVSQ